MRYQPKVNSGFQETSSKALVLFAREATEVSFKKKKIIIEKRVRGREVFFGLLFDSFRLTVFFSLWSLSWDLSPRLCYNKEYPRQKQ